MSLIKEKAYNKVIVNSANKYLLCKLSFFHKNYIEKNEEEYLENLFEIE